MKLKAMVKSLDQVPEQFRSLYTEKDGEFHLELEDAEDNGALKRALDRERTEKNAVKEMLAKVKDIDPVKYAELVRMSEDLEKKKLEDKGQFEALRLQMVEQHKTELQKKADREARLVANISELLVDAEATRELSRSEVKGSARLLLPHIRSKTRVVEGEDGKFKLEVLGDDGKPRVNGEGKPIGLTDLIGELRKDKEFGGAFTGTGSSGSGAPAGGGGPAGGGDRSMEGLSPTERLTKVRQAQAEAAK